MSDVLVMNKAHMESLTQRFRQKAEEVERLRAEVTNLLGSTTWDGARARRFRDEWNGTFSPNLVKLQTALDENAGFLDQERANAMTAMD
ncbi:MAG: WXG100 family type VII secretion target [Acidimicrobiia bacterium]|nr:WXG100 family type VII secretion target [Acidimicrobiia bacterium]